MKRMLAMSALLLSAQAGACPDLEVLAKRYGISFSGFLTPIPAAKRPAFSHDGRLLHLQVDSPAFVSDGFRHKVVFDSATRKAWILRTGGFAGVREWYGPVDAGDARLENCRSDATRIEEPLKRG